VKYLIVQLKERQPASFPLNAVINGWTEALQLMPVGSKWKLYIPPHLLTV
jgi:FKBP-type peptidyl-prolyl cis-trans isomerase FklB